MQANHDRNTSTTPRRLLRLPSVLDRVGIKKTKWYSEIKEGKAPAPVRLGAQSVAWLESDIDAYIESLKKTSTK